MNTIILEQTTTGIPSLDAELHDQFHLLFLPNGQDSELSDTDPTGTIRQNYTMLV